MKKAGLSVDWTRVGFLDGERLVVAAILEFCDKFSMWAVREVKV